MSVRLSKVRRAMFLQRASRLSRKDDSSIKADSAAASVGFSFAIGGAVSIAVTLSDNTIENEVVASISNATVSATLGNVALSSINNPKIESNAVAAGISGGLVAASAAGVQARNSIGGQTWPLCKTLLSIRPTQGTCWSRLNRQPHPNSPWRSRHRRWSRRIHRCRHVHNASQQHH